MTDLHRDASQRLTVAVVVEAAAVGKLAASVIAHFALMPVGPATGAVDVAWREYAAGSCRVSLDWDPWLGFQVVALAPAAEPLVERIAAFLADGGDRATM